MKIKTIGLAAAVTLTLAACGSDTDDTDDDGTDVPAVTATEDASDDTTDDATDGGEDMTDEPTGTNDGSSTEDAPDQSIDLNGYDFEVSLEQAIDISDDETGGGTIYQVGMDWSDGAWVWQIDTEADGQEWELKINASTGDIMETDRDDDDDDERGLELESVIGHMEAMETAAAEASGRVTEWELDWDDDRQEYTVDIDDDIDVIIDAISGEILEVDN